MDDEPGRGVERDRLREIWGGGSDKESHRLRPNHWTVAEVETRIALERIEWVYVFDLFGRQLLRKRGTVDGVFFAADELPLLQDAILIHNHPPYLEFALGDPRRDGGSFSERDLDLVVSYDLAEMRAITSRWRHVVTRPMGGWPIDADSLVALYRQTIAEVDVEFRAARPTDTESRGALRATRVHLTVERVAAWAGFAYRREER